MNLPSHLISFFMVLFLNTFVQAYTHRLALFIGNNEGLISERPLKYAARDASHMAFAFKDEGGIEKDGIYLLENQSLKKIRAAIQEIRGRVIEMRKRIGKVMVLIYYSGHGSSNALHIRGEKLSREELNRHLEALSADLKLIIIDACESGDLLRSKGGEVISEYQIKSEDNLGNKGTIMLTSSSRGELAQESERYKGAVYTHHFLNGIRGVADYNNDQEISLWEAYNYASFSTRSENVLRGIQRQNPSFDFDMVGKKDIVLTTLRKRRSSVLLRNLPQVSLEIHDAASMETKTVILLTGRDSVIYKLPSKEYFFTYEQGNVINVARGDMSYGKTLRLSPASFKQVSKTEAYRKGGKSFSLNPCAMRLAFANISIGPIKAFPTISASYVIRNYFFHQFLGFGWGRKSERGEMRTGEYNLLRMSYSICKPFLRHRFGQFLAGGELSAYHLWQYFEDTRFTLFPNPNEDKIPENYTKNSTFFELCLPLEKELFFPWGFLLSAALQPTLIYHMESGGGWSFAPDIRPVFSVGFRF